MSSTSPATPPTADSTAGSVAGRRPVLAIVADVIAVVIFAAIGRRSHAESSALAGVALTAWPFLTGTALGWVVVRARGLAPFAPRTGAVIVASTVIVAMLLRALTGRGVAVSFVIVATTVLSLFLIGWRRLATRRG